MKTIKLKSLIVIASIVITTGLITENASAQRSSRGGGRSGGSIGHVSSSRGRTSSGFSSNRVSHYGGSSSYHRSSGTQYVRPNHNVRSNNNYIRSGHHYYPGHSYRYNRPYYSYYHFYRPYLGFYLNALPFGYYPFFYGDNQFYYDGGLFYRQYDEGYQVVAPPVGAEIPSLPSDVQQVVINGQTFYEYKGIYYTENVNSDGKTVYVVAGKDGVLNTNNGSDNSPQVGSIVNQLPEGCRQVMLKGQKYYVSPDDIYYEEVVDGNNITYRVIGELN